MDGCHHPHHGQPILGALDTGGMKVELERHRIFGTIMFCLAPSWVPDTGRERRRVRGILHLFLYQRHEVSPRYTRRLLSLYSFLFDDRRHRPSFPPVAKLLHSFRYPIFESWFIACIPNSPLVSYWRDEFMQLQKHKNAGQYIKALRAEGVDLQWLAIPEYLAIHAALQKVLQKSGHTFK